MRTWRTARQDKAALRWTTVLPRNCGLMHRRLQEGNESMRDDSYDKNDILKSVHLVFFFLFHAS